MTIVLQKMNQTVESSSLEEGIKLNENLTLRHYVCNIILLIIQANNGH